MAVHVRSCSLLIRSLWCLQTLNAIAQVLKDKQVDVVLYLDRLDFYRVEKTDKEIMTAITNTLGPKIWRNTIIGLTHGKAIPPQGFFTDRQGMQASLHACRRPPRDQYAVHLALPAALGQSYVIGLVKLEKHIVLIVLCADVGGYWWVLVGTCLHGWLWMQVTSNM